MPISVIISFQILRKPVLTTYSHNDKTCRCHNDTDVIEAFSSAQIRSRENDYTSWVHIAPMHLATDVDFCTQISNSKTWWTLIRPSSLQQIIKLSRSSLKWSRLMHHLRSLERLNSNLVLVLHIILSMSRVSTIPSFCNILHSATNVQFRYLAASDIINLSIVATIKKCASECRGFSSKQFQVLLKQSPY